MERETIIENRTEIIQAYLLCDDTESIKQALAEQHTADIVSYIEELSPAEIIRVIRLLSIELQAEIFGFFDTDTQVEVAELLTRSELIQIITHMSHDERADLFKELSEEQQEALLPGLAQAERDDIRKLSSYPDDQAGSVMTSDYATLLPSFTCEKAIAHLRRVAPERETIYTAFVVDSERRLLGTVSLKDLILANPKQVVAQIMKKDVVHLFSRAPREEAVQLISDYDLMALPVVDRDDRLVGIITIDDALDIAEEETDIDFHKSSAIGNLVDGIKDTSITMLYRKRVFWLVTLVFGNILSGAGIAFFEDVISNYIVLVFFLPLLIGSGGNAGAQSATLMVRALATRDVLPSDWLRMLGKEILIASMLAITMSIAVSLIGFWRGGPEIALVVCSTMILVVVGSSLIGMSIPFLLTRFKFDPAAASAPLITCIADIFGVVIYFTIATMLLDFT